MDDRHFDRLIHSLGQSTSRQAVVRLLTGVFSFALLGGAGTASAGAAICLRGGRPCRSDGQCCSGHCVTAICQPEPKKKRRQPKKHVDKPDHKPERTCSRGHERCGGKCADLRTSNKHCGRCNRACSPIERCENGACQDVCAPGACPEDRCVPMVNRKPGCYVGQPLYARCSDRCQKMAECPPPDFLGAPLCLYQPGGDCPDTFICGFLS